MKKENWIQLAGAWAHTVWLVLLYWLGVWMKLERKVCHVFCHAYKKKPTSVAGVITGQREKLSKEQILDCVPWSLSCNVWYDDSVHTVSIMADSTLLVSENCADKVLVLLWMNIIILWFYVGFSFFFYRHRQVISGLSAFFFNGFKEQYHDIMIWCSQFILHKWDMQVFNISFLLYGLNLKRKIQLGGKNNMFVKRYFLAKIQ